METRFRSIGASGITGWLAPDGLTHVASWVTPDLTRCYQVMECADRALLDTWMNRWRDLVDFQVIPIITSADASSAVADRL